MSNKNGLAVRAAVLPWRPSALELPLESRLVRQCEEPAAISTVITEAIYQNIKLHTRETPVENVLAMVRFEIEESGGFDELRVWQSAARKIMRRKVYGQFTPHDLNEVLSEAREEAAIERERAHDLGKGADNYKRHSGRLSDHFKGL